MALIVQKYGGTSVGDLERISGVARRVQRYRDQGRNVADCMDRLRQMILSVAAPPVKRRPTRPSRGAKQRPQLRIGGTRAW